MVIIDPVIRINTCKAIGRTGPTTEQCAQENNRTNLYNDIDLSISKQNNTLISYMNGIQRWTAPRGEYYTLVMLLKNMKLSYMYAKFKDIRFIIIFQKKLINMCRKLFIGKHKIYDNIQKRIL